ncbi:uncharacterized protein MICPUCDRAFT_55078 [Micromonas pusilla CCMP1545]|uniref:Predicted protein n=1 Tax=Micromonas pusilla (strain CCMP1545) TaxID=564608 RepID=C1MJS6_MICPC|nr:uncharacterized protein MICPUCDRAFT_55078 [Micromonas pusilla CCMP1545]EEH59639.1 predicted protein [Micromonas pusilla CCMP1545]|eukprot:XP_003056263.1 predicted protein [Micromonas pusilla CCMP1545]
MERRARYETDGCATLPNPLPRGARAAWIEGAAENTAAFQSAGYDYSRTHASFLWKLDGAETFLNGCEEREVRGGAMRMRSWTGKNCVAEDPNNAFGCYWRYDAQAFEGCGCVVAAAATCLCDRVADVTVSEYKIDTVSLDELTSLSTGDVLNTWRVLAVVGGMFFGSLLLASALHLRATLGKRRLLRRLVDPAKNRDLGFAVVQRVWTWHIDVQEMQFMFNATHRANDEDAVAAALLASHDAKGDYDAAAASKLETRRRMLELEREGVEGDAAAADVARAVERRVEEYKRGARTIAGLPSCDKARLTIRGCPYDRVGADTIAVPRGLFPRARVFFSLSPGCPGGFQSRRTHLDAFQLRF